MFYIRLSGGKIEEISSTYPKEPTGWEWARNPSGARATGWMTSRDFITLEHAQTMAERLQAFDGNSYLATDESESTSPRYRVIQAPKIGDAVSKSFNGDSYPCGHIIKITPTWNITTDTGAKFRRYKQTSGWREQGRGFWMAAGHIDERNPSF